MAKRLIAVASAGGHWEQLMLVKEAFAESETRFITTRKGLVEKAGIINYLIVRDCNRNTPITSIVTSFKILIDVIKFKPDIVISTGALPGAIALTAGKLVGAKTAWIDSVANAERLSRSGTYTKKIADLWLCQWQHLAEQNGVQFEGRLL
ncbi:hypothetical protein [Sphingobium yanoikuyae]|uniref:hypothetical protein n=1 Tax=Sphingobium yanoikuyae TaxID=13690 RepID=UPI0009C07862|nr:hypothetical protein [Sphingobium yanoikuyae]